MNNNRLLTKNEHEANIIAAKAMLATIIFVILVYVLDIIKVFIVPLFTMTIALSAATVFLLIPAFLVMVLKLQGSWVKYVIITSAALMVGCMNMFLTYHVVILYTYAIAISSLYFSRKLSWYAVLSSISLLTIGQVLSFRVDSVVDNNFKVLIDTILFGIIPRDIELTALSLIFIFLSKRTRNMLENVMGAEEQKNLLDKTLSITNKSQEVSNVLANSVRQLSEITDQTKGTNEQIARNTSKIASGSENTLKFVDEAVNAIVTISKNLNDAAQEAKNISEVSRNVNQMTENSRTIIENAANEMFSIHEATNESKEIITKLGERSSEIGKIVEVITAISGQTNLLALNAAIESARAGEQGKGFAVVASQIRVLAEQSEKAAKDIGKLIKEVLDDTKNAVESMDKGTKLADSGLSAVNDAGKAFKEVSEASRSMNYKVQEVNSVISNVAGNGDKIVDIIQNIRNINYDSIEEIQSIAAAAQQQLASMEQVASSVSHIDKISDELLEVTK